MTPRGAVVYKPRFQKTKKSKVSKFQEKSKEIERKSLDIVQNAGVIPASPTWTLPTLSNGIAQGTTSAQRLGRRFTNVAFHYRAVLQPAAPSPCRILVIYDRQPNQLLPAVVDILSADHFNSPMNLFNAERFLVLSDKVFQNSLDGSATSLFAKDYIKMSLESVFTGTGGLITDCNTGAIYTMICQGANGVAAGAFTLHARSRFTDA